MENFENGYALIIGVGRDLPATIKDAKAMYEVLTDPKKAGYRKEQVTLLTGKAATKDGILTALHQLSQTVAQKPDATVIIYYSGHGGEAEEAWGDDRSYFLLPYDYDTSDYTNTCIPAQDFVAKVNALEIQKSVILLDCCHAGGMKKAGRTERFQATPKQLVNELDKGTGRVIMASSQAEQLSYIGQQYSIFTECLLEAFQGKNTPKDEEYVSINQLIDYVGKEVPQRAKKLWDEQQVPITRMEATHFSVCKNYAVKTNSFLQIDQNFELEQARKTYTSVQKQYSLLQEQINAVEEAMMMEPNALTKQMYQQRVDQLKTQLEGKAEKKQELLEKIEALA